MATDLIQRAAAICGYPFTPNSDQLAAWLDSKHVAVCIDSMHSKGTNWVASVDCSNVGRSSSEWVTCEPTSGTLLHCLAAAVVEVDRIEREARNAHQA